MSLSEPVNMVAECPGSILERNSCAIMETPANILAALLEAIEQQLGHLIAAGFQVLRDQAVIEPTFVEVQMVAQNVALVFSVDVRDAVTDLYVAKADSGCASRRGTGGYFERLTFYLREKHLPSKNPMPEVPRPSPLLERVRHDVAVYAAMLRNAPALISDTETFGVRSGEIGDR